MLILCFGYACLCLGGQRKERSLYPSPLCEFIGILSQDDSGCMQHTRSSCFWSLMHLQHPRQFAAIIIYLWKKVICLYLWDLLNCVLGVFGKLSMRRGAWAWFHDVWTCGAKVLEYWMILSLKIKLNCSWKFQRNWNVPLVLLERSWWAGFKGIYLVRFEFRMWEILILKVISAAENSNKFQNTRFWKEKSVEVVITLGQTAQATLVMII